MHSGWPVILSELANDLQLGLNLITLEALS